MMEISKGLVCSDCENTIFGSRFADQHPSDKPKDFNRILFGYLIALKKSGYDVAIMSDQALANEIRVGMAVETNTGDINFLTYDDQLVITKNEMEHVPALAVFDDNHSSHAVKTDYKFDPANPAVLEYLKQQLEIFNTTGSIEFDPAKLMEIQLMNEAEQKSKMGRQFLDGAKQVLGGTIGNMTPAESVVPVLDSASRSNNGSDYYLQPRDAEVLTSAGKSYETVVVLGYGPDAKP
jgi:hypothetical protein